MSALIKKLKEQATSYTWNGDGVTEELDEHMLAKLIVQECADIALKSGNIANKNIAAKIESERIYHKIREHFGVDE